MGDLLVQSCSARKIEEPGAIPALERYDGYYYRIIKKAKREDALRSDLNLSILSAKHGVLDPDTHIKSYDRRMTRQRAKTLRPEVLAALKEKVKANGIDRIIVNVAKDYRAALEGISDEVHVDVKYISGEGIGVKGQKLKKYIRGSTTFAADGGY